jgi:hypothetical protein
MKKFSLVISVTLIIVGLCCISSKAMSPEDSVNGDYLIKHGYSPEMVRLINLQKERIGQEGDTSTDNSLSENIKLKDKAKKVIKQMYETSDVTMSPNFANNRIKF